MLMECAPNALSNDHDEDDEDEESENSDHDGHLLIWITLKGAVFAIQYRESADWINLHAQREWKGLEIKLKAWSSTSECAEQKTDNHWK